jgi:hypothetical protein
VSVAGRRAAVTGSTRVQLGVQGMRMPWRIKHVFVELRRARRGRRRASHPGLRISALKYSMVPPTSKWQVAACDRISPIKRRCVLPTKRAAEYASLWVDDIEQVVRHQAARSAAVGLAVPMSMPR